MNRWESWSFHFLTLVLTVTGMSYFWMKHMIQTDDPFSVTNHPWEPLMLKVHILAAPLFLLAVGLMIQSHVVRKARNGNAGLKSGLASLALFALMTGSGYALQVVSDPDLHTGIMTVHLSSGILFAMAYLVHQIVGIVGIKRGRARAGAPAEPLPRAPIRGPQRAVRIRSVETQRPLPQDRVFESTENAPLGTAGETPRAGSLSGTLMDRRLPNGRAC